MQVDSIEARQVMSLTGWMRPSVLWSARLWIEPGVSIRSGGGCSSVWLKNILLSDPCDPERHGPPHKLLKRKPQEVPDVLSTQGLYLR